jgi:REP element-mobilizing transposase RayT
MQNTYHKKSHSKYLIKLHFVIAVKYRKPLLIGRISDDIQQIVFDCCTEKGIITSAKRKAIKKWGIYVWLRS